MNGPTKGSLSVLNVGAGDIKLSFNSSNVQEVIRARRMIQDMLRRGYALLIEVERGGEKRYERALDFDETKGEYIIADYDPQENSDWDEEVLRGKDVQEQDQAAKTPGPAPADEGRAPAKPKGPGRGNYPRHKKGVPVAETNAIAVGRSAGG